MRQGDFASGRQAATQGAQVRHHGTWQDVTKNFLPMTLHDECHRTRGIRSQANRGYRIDVYALGDTGDQALLGRALQLFLVGFAGGEKYLLRKYRLLSFYCWGNHKHRPDVSY